MSIYSEKLISVEFKLASNSDEVVRLDGYRCEVNMQNAGGRSQSKIDMVIYNVNQDLSQLIVGQGFSFNTTRSVVSLLAGEKITRCKYTKGRYLMLMSIITKCLTSLCGYNLTVSITTK